MNTAHGHNSNYELVPERKLSKTVISSVAKNFMVLLILTFKISPFGRNDKKWGFRSGTNYEYHENINFIYKAKKFLISNSMSLT